MMPIVNRNTMSLYEITEKGRELENLFLYGDLDEETLKDSQEFLVAELEQKSKALVYLYKQFESFVGKTTKKSVEDLGAIEREIRRLKELKSEYQARFTNYKSRLAQAMYSIGMKTGKANGVMTDIGVLTLTTSKVEIKPNLDAIDNKYIKQDITLKNLTVEQMGKVQNFLKENGITDFSVAEKKLNKELYQEEVGIEKEQHYSVTVK